MGPGRALARAVLAFATLLALNVASEAQSAACRQIEVELASLDRPVNRPGRAARAERAMLSRVQGNIAALGCNRGFVLFGPQAPPQCSGLKAQASALQGRIADIEAPTQVASAANPRRRMQLMAALDSYGCRGRQVVAAPQPQPQSRSIFDVLFGRPVPSSQPQYSTAPLPDGSLPPLVDGKPVDGLEDPDARKFGGGGSLAICVRTCDGFFFPVNYEGARGQDRYAEACQASCPNASTEVYWMPPGADLDRAANASGVNYSQLPSAFKYRQSYDPSCTCKPRDQTWAVALRQAESLVATRRTDITVTSESSAQMARPTPLNDLRGTRSTKKNEALSPPRPAGEAQADKKLITGVVVPSLIDPAPRDESATDGEDGATADGAPSPRSIRRIRP